MLPFKRQYLIAAAILSVLATMGAIGGVSSGEFGLGLAVIPLSIAALALFPIFWKGGILANPRLSIGIAAFFAVATGIMVAVGFVHFVLTGGGEGPKGEGSPLESMIALAFGAAVGFCPWLLATLRGLPHWNKDGA
jgi:hypothetical protein